MKFDGIRSMLSVILFFSATSHAYDWEHNLAGYVTRCFQISQIQVGCDDLSEPSWGIKERGELNIEAVDYSGNKFSYGYLKGIDGPLCKKHLRQIKRLFKNNAQACITGWGESISGGETSAHWQAFETKSGKINW